LQLKTILNRVQKFKRFIFEDVSWAENTEDTEIEVGVRARSNSWAQCSRCRQDCPGYDVLAERRYEFIPLWGIKVFLVYAPRRVSCSQCGVRVERVPWAVGKHRLTTAYARKGHKYLTLVYQIDVGHKRLLWLGKERKESTLQAFFDWFGSERSGTLEYVCSDMWKPYLNVIAANAGQAIHILDRYHIMATINKAIDKVRAEEAKKMKVDGYDPVLKKTRWLLLKRPENLTDKQDMKLSELLQYNLRSVRSYLLKEEFQQLWTYTSPYWAGLFLDRWCTKTMRSKIDPMKKVARQMRKHRPLIMNWFEAKGMFSSGIVEGFNNKAKLTMRKSYGFKSPDTIEIALYHALGALPEPQTAHRFF